jgi:chemotaxis protein methyltransferase CheR
MAIEPADLEYVCDLVRQKSAIVLDASKDYLVEARLKPLAKELGFGDLAKLIAALRGASRGDLVVKVVEAMTTNETTFFRDAQPFEVLRTSVLPALIAKRQATQTLRFWSAASSTGQEPYSLAMLLEEHFPQLKNWNVSILATDIASTVIAKAKTGKYHQLEVNRGLPARYLTKYFQQEGLSWTLRESVRRRVEFKQLNLAAAWPTLATMDIVFIRNVLIYFDTETRRTILGKVRQRLAPDGYLFVGSTETTVNIDNSFARAPYERASCYTPIQAGPVSRGA